MAILPNLTLAGIYFISQLITRITLSCYALSQHQIIKTDLLKIFILGVINDIVVLCYSMVAILVIKLIFGSLIKKFIASGYSICLTLAHFAVILLLLGVSVAEIVFWEEFGTRFNFIAVDYLVYTREIVGTLNESLPLPAIICSVIFIALSITAFSRKIILNNITYCVRLGNQLIILSLFILLSYLCFTFFDSNKYNKDNRYASELAKNGLYELFSAFRNNSLDYLVLYNTINDNLALENVRKSIIQPNQTFINNIDIARINKSLTKDVSRKQFNVVLIVVESLSSRFLSTFGNQDHITPNIDRIIQDSILFSNLYATGTRTVRGLEAVTLSIVPTPGSSIIRRQNNQNLFNIATIFKHNDYDVNFIFGGYSYFDNLQNYFSGNGYKITDRNDFNSDEITFSNIWGLADEDVFNKTIKIIDESYKKGKSFFSLVLTTSNHRPYTFPAGKIDLPSGSGRLAAVKYTDYAIGKFIDDAKKHQWFKDTIFVITADHCAVGTGNTDLPIDKYHIPFIIYAPHIVKGQVIDSLSSQIDIPPTIINLALPNIEYISQFFGKDILNYKAERAFIGTYQLLGYISNDKLAILHPNKIATNYEVNSGSRKKAPYLENFINEAVSFYQTAYNLYIQNRLIITP